VLNPTRSVAALATRRALWALWLLLAAAAAGAERDEPALVIQGATLIDGTGRAPRPDTVVVVRGDRIAAVVRRSGYRAPTGARVVDARGRFVVPGFADMHAHVAFLRNPTAPDAGYDRATTERVLRILLASGITTVRNPAAPTADGVALRDDVASGRIVGPRIFTAGASINLRRRGTGGPTSDVSSEDEIRAEVRRQAAAGVDFIKLYNALPPDLVRAAIDEAHAHRVRVIGHLQATTWTEAARFGIDAIAHGAPWSAAYLPAERRARYDGTMKGRIDWLEGIDVEGPEIREMLAELARRRVALDPTLVAYHTKFWGDDPIYLRSPDLALVPEPMLESWRRGTFVDDWTASDFRRARAAWPTIERLVRLYHRQGVLLTAGSDLPNPWVVPGAGFHRELELLVAAGLSPSDVLRIATRNAAEALGILDSAGTVEPGKRADLVVLAADPLADIRNTRRVLKVVAAGIVLDPKRLLD
jgi:imidazolonepropionase-like amidohydrolase